MKKSNYKLLISYDGTRYYGFEHQPDKDTIQGKLEAVFSRMTGETVEIIGAGRTDAGVHAREMVVNCFLTTDMTPEEILRYANRYLPDDISVDEVRIASDRFHARYNAVGKTYQYTCVYGPRKQVFQRKYSTQLSERPDVEKMQKAAEYLIGKHDFKSFCGNPKMKKSTVRIIDEIQIREKKDFLYFTFHGTGFLQHMVRILVGTLLMIGQSDLPAEKMQDILAAEDRKEAGQTAPPEGLCLIKVDYM